MPLASKDSKSPAARFDFTPSGKKRGRPVGWRKANPSTPAKRLEKQRQLQRRYAQERAA